MFSGDADIPWGINYPLGSLKKKKTRGIVLCCLTRLGWYPATSKISDFCLWKRPFPEVLTTKAA